MPEHICAGGRQRLVDAEINVPTLAGIATSDLVSSVAKGSKHLGHRIVYQDVAISQKQDLGATVLPGPVPSAVPQLPANLESDTSLASPCRKRGKNALLPQQDCFDHPIDGDLLVITRQLARDQIEWLQHMRSGVLGQVGSG